MNVSIGSSALEGSVLTLERIRDKYPIMIKARERPQKSDIPIGKIIAASSDLSIFSFSDKLIDLYNEKLEKFYHEYESFREEITSWKEYNRFLVEVKLNIVNDGTVPASDVDVILVFPPDLQLLERRDIPKWPKMPEPPSQPTGILGSPEFFPGSRRDNFAKVSLMNYSQNPPEIDGIPNINAEKHEVTINVSKLKHGISRQVKSFFFRFPNQMTVRSFEIKFKMSADELSEPVTGKFPVNVSEPKEPE